MISLIRPLSALAAMIIPILAEPLAEGAFVDFIVVPVGPVPLAEFESTDKAAPAAPAGNAKNAGRAPSSGGAGSGVKVKEADPSEIPPTAVFLKKGSGEYYQIPCFLNSVGVPVRTPVADSEIVFLTKTANAADAFVQLEKRLLPTTGQRVLVLLTKPLAEKKWSKPTVTLIPIPGPATASVLVANASSTASCGAVFGQEKKILLPALKHCSWKPAEPSRIAIAMAAPGGGFQAPLFDEYMKVETDAITLIIPYEVTPQESFRRGKYSHGIVRNGDFRPAPVIGGDAP